MTALGRDAATGRDAPSSPPCPRPKPHAAAPLVIFRLAPGKDYRPGLEARTGLADVNGLEAQHQGGQSGFQGEVPLLRCDKQRVGVF